MRRPFFVWVFCQSLPHLSITYVMIRVPFLSLRVLLLLGDSVPPSCFRESAHHSAQQHLHKTVRRCGVCQSMQLTPAYFRIRAEPMFHEDVAVWARMPRWLLLPCSFDEVQGRQTWPPLVPKNFSRLLPHKVTMGSLSQDEKFSKKSVIPDLPGWEGVSKEKVFRWVHWPHSRWDKVTWGEELRQTSSFKAPEDSNKAP